MRAEIQKMSPSSKVWIYQADREFNEVEAAQIQLQGLQFIENWTAHDNPLLAGFSLLYNRFLLFVVDEESTGASGCSIDKSIHLIRKFENDFNVSLLNRLNVAYKVDDKIYSTSKAEFEDLLKDGKINEKTIVFNNMVLNLGEFNAKWEGSIENSWHKQLI